MLVNLVNKWEHTWLDCAKDGSAKLRLEVLREAVDSARKSLGSCKRILRRLVDYLFAYFGKEVIVLVDEFDAPIHRAGTKEQKDIVGMHIGDMLLPVVKVCDKQVATRHYPSRCGYSLLFICATSM